MAGKEFEGAGQPDPQYQRLETLSETYVNKVNSLLLKAVENPNQIKVWSIFKVG